MVAISAPADGILRRYESISIGYTTSSKVDLDVLRNTGNLVEIPMPERWKDYDDCEEDRPTSLPTRWDTRHWGVLTVELGGEIVGGAIVARKCLGLDLLEGREDLAHIMDIRVATNQRGKGVGRQLLNAVVDWSKARGCTVLHVETQDINVQACRFYKAMGFALHSADENAYAGLDEARLIWARSL